MFLEILAKFQMLLQKFDCALNVLFEKNWLLTIFIRIPNEMK